MTQGALGQPVRRGVPRIPIGHRQVPGVAVLATDPADWDVAKAAQLWETYLNTFPKIDAAFFHNDDMALAAANVMKAQGRTGDPDWRRGRDAAGHPGGGRRPHARHGPQFLLSHPRRRHRRRRHRCARAETGLPIPKRIVIDGPIVTKTNAPGMLWMEEQFLI